MNAIIKPLLKSITEGNFAQVVCLFESSFLSLLKQLEEKMVVRVVKSLLNNYKDKKNENLVYSFYKGKAMQKSAQSVTNILILILKWKPSFFASIDSFIDFKDEPIKVIRLARVFLSAFSKLEHNSSIHLLMHHIFSYTEEQFSKKTMKFYRILILENIEKPYFVAILKELYAQMKKFNYGVMKAIHSVFENNLEDVLQLS